MNAIEIKNVSKNFGDFAIQNLNFELPQGSICGLVGENGAGKSTTIRLIMQALRPDSGEISVLGVNNRSQEFQQIKEDIGIVLDEAY
ncbi:putative ABC transporter ATP-binding protein NosF [bioreactor metagenome]|uniref:Putative ABC transporter ATP-binding protein NosF n=1 Tax=bioreactor metagenome TaxID=1076179 RepID=A0A645C018_9ZZZZ